MKGDRSIKLTALPNYEARILLFQSAKQKLETQSNRVGAARLLAFLLMVVMVYVSIKIKNTALLIIPFLLLAGFLYLVKLAVNLKREINFQKILITINQEEIQALAGDHSAFDPGINFIDYHHEYSYDLDIFGEHSIYRLVNRTATPLGRKTLGHRLLYPGNDAASIRQRQEAVRELVNKLEWRQNFLATARESDWEQNPDRQIRSWLDAPDRFSKTRFFQYAIWINSIITLSIFFLTIFPPILLSLFPSLSLSVFRLPSLSYLYFLIPIGLIISRTRVINREQERLERLLEMFRKYAGLLQLIEKESFIAPKLNDLKSSLKQG